MVSRLLIPRRRSAGPRPRRDPAGPLLLLLGVLAACAYAVFADGATSLPEEAWLQSALALLAVAGAVVWLGPSGARPGASPWALAGLALLVAFAAWAGVSLLWSVAPDRTWEEVNRILAYALVVVLALGIGSTLARPVERVAAGWVVIATAVALYALAGAIAPGVVDHARDVARLRAPLGSSNMLGLVCVLAVAPAIRFATARTLGAAWRIAALLALVLLLTCLGLTQSRDGLLALLVALVVLVAATGPRLPSLAAFGLGALAAAPALAFAWTDDRLTADRRPLADQIDAGLLLGGALLGGLVLAALAGWWLLRVERRAAWPPRRSRTVWLALAVAGVALVAGALTAGAVSDRGLRGTVEAAADEITQEDRDPVRSAATREDRTAWWREAGGAFADEPVTGWGAGSFVVSRRLYRAAPGEVPNPHSTPMQFLAATGVVGAVLGLGALALLLTAAALRVRRRDDDDPTRAGDRERALAAALLAAGAAWAAHSLVDRDWDVPGVTVPALLLLGVLGARHRRIDEPGVAAASEPRPGRVLALAAASVVALAVLASALLPAFSDARADAAYRGVGERNPEALQDAAADAERAARLNPLAVRPLFAAAAVAEGRGRALEARGHLLDAVERQPWNVEAWTRLSRIAERLADREGAELAASRALELDPGDPETAAFARRAQGLLSPPQGSATATGTPLPPAPGTVAPAPPSDPALPAPGG